MRNLYYETMSTIFEHNYTLSDIKKVVLTKASGQKVIMTWEQFADLAKTINYKLNKKEIIINQSLTIYLKDSHKLCRWYWNKHEHVYEFWRLEKYNPSEEFPEVNPIDFIADPEKSESNYVID